MSDIKHTASLEVIIYGKKAIDQLTSSLEQAAVEFENIRNDATAAAAATKKFGDQQMQSSRLIVRNAKDAAKAIQIINEEQQKSLIGASKSQIAARKRMFADIGLSMPGRVRPSTAQAAEGRVRNLIEGKTKSAADLGRSFTEINKQLAQVEKGRQEARRAQAKIPVGQRHDPNDIDTLELYELFSGVPLSPKDQKELRRQKEDQAYAQNEKALHEATQALKELKFASERAAAQLRMQKAAEKAAAADFERRVKTEQEFQTQYDRPVGKRHSARRMAELQVQMKNPDTHDTLLADIEEQYSQHLLDKLVGESDKRFREAEKGLNALKAAAKKAKNEQQRRISRENAEREEADRQTERFLTSMVPRQLQPFFRRGGLFMQGEYRNRPEARGPFGGIRGALGRGGQFGEGGEGGPSGPMRVIAYDALRRVLTETYAMVSKIAGTFKDWIIEGVKFNDELVRAQTFFTSLGLIGMKGASGKDITVAEASVSSNVKIKQAYEKSSVAAEEMMNRMMAVSALTGQDLGEIVSSARQSMTDLLNKVNKTSGGKTSAFLENPKMFGDVSERMVKLASVLRMSDPQNRKLGFHMVGLQELFSGSTGGKKDTGLQNVLSILRREGIRIEQGVATEITKMVNKGDITGAMDVVEDALSRAGLGMVQLENMLNSTLQPAIDGAIMYAKIFNRIFTKALYENSLKPFFRSLLKTSDLIFRNKDKMAALEQIGAAFARSLDPIFLRLTQLLDFIQGGYSDARAMAYANNVIETVAGIIDAILAFAEVMVAFVAGLMGGAGGAGLDQLSEWIRSFTPMMFNLGVTIRRVIEFIQGFDASIGNLIKNIALIVATLAIVYGAITGIGSVILSVIAPVLGFIWTFLRLRAAFMIVGSFLRDFAGMIIARFIASRAIKPVSSMAPNINLLPRAAAQAATQAATQAAVQGAAQVAAQGAVAQAATGATVGATAGTVARVGLLARAGTMIGGVASGVGAMLSGGAIMTAITPLLPWIIGAVLVAGAAYFAYSRYNQRETNAEVPTENKRTAMRNVQPTTATTVNKSTVNNNNPTINVTVTGVAGSPQQIGNSVGAGILDAFRSIYNPVQEA